MITWSAEAARAVVELPGSSERRWRLFRVGNRCGCRPSNASPSGTSSALWSICTPAACTQPARKLRPRSNRGRSALAGRKVGKRSPASNARSRPSAPSREIVSRPLMGPRSWPQGIDRGRISAEVSRVFEDAQRELVAAG